jgi:hypothetical protein
MMKAMRRSNESRLAILIGVALIGFAALSIGPWSSHEAQRQEPPDEIWFDASGQPVRDASTPKEGLVLNFLPGAEHCNTQSVTFLELAWPLGSVAPLPLREDQYRHYVRDPHGVLDPALLRGSFDSDVKLPIAARATGYYSDSAALWIDPTDVDRFVYLIRGKMVERWPRARRPIYCY